MAGIQMVKDEGGIVYDQTLEESAAWSEAARSVIAKWKADAIDLGVSTEACDTVLEKWKELRVKYKL
jgi:hypothetical protein